MSQIYAKKNIFYEFYSPILKREAVVSYDFFCISHILDICALWKAYY